MRFGYQTIPDGPRPDDLHRGRNGCEDYDDPIRFSSDDVDNSPYYECECSASNGLRLFHVYLSLVGVLVASLLLFCVGGTCSGGGTGDDEFVVHLSRHDPSLAATRRHDAYPTTKSEPKAAGGKPGAPTSHACEFVYDGSGQGEGEGEGEGEGSGNGEEGAFRPRRVRVIQTSLESPSRHWRSIPCPSTSGNHRSDAGASTKTTEKDNTIIVRVDLNGRRFQPIMGFGGAFTEATARNYKSLGTDGRTAILELLFGKSGLGYNMGRVHIDSCDFSVGNYNFDDVDGDFDLKNFDRNVTHDVESGMIEMMLRADEVLREGWPTDGDFASDGGGRGRSSGLRIVASPWSPPGWMKKPLPPPGPVHDWGSSTSTSGTTTVGTGDGASSSFARTMDRTAFPIGLRDGTGARSKYAASWALYVERFISAYEGHGVPIWAVTVQNEPDNDVTWEACAYTAEGEAEFVANHLGPTLRSSHPNVRILAYDYNKDHCVTWMQTLLLEGNGTNDRPVAASAASSYIDGVAVHWYAREDLALSGAQGSPNMHRLKELLVSHKARRGRRQRSRTEEIPFVLGTEACHCFSTGYALGDLEVSWTRAERYAHSILADLSAGSMGWIEWNLVLDSIGGPNHLGNFCDAPIVAVPHRTKEEVPVPLDKHRGVPSSSLPAFKNSTVGAIDSVMGDRLSRDDLARTMGYPADLMDVGVVVQPMYYYVGHISRFVRPGSRPVSALVVGGADSTDLPVDDAKKKWGRTSELAMEGIEATIWPCDSSTRQIWELDGHGRLFVTGRDTHATEPKETVSHIPTTRYCLPSSPDPSFTGLLLTRCDSGNVASFDVNAAAAKHSDHSSSAPLNAMVTLSVRGEEEEKCLIIIPLANDGGASGLRGGSQVGFGSCGEESALWAFSEDTGELRSNFISADTTVTESVGEDCLTAGWPFLQAGAFDTSKSSTNGYHDRVVVLLNEANEGVDFVVKMPGIGHAEDGETPIVRGRIPARSIQTLLLS